MRRFGIWKDGKQIGEGVLWSDGRTATVMFPAATSPTTFEMRWHVNGEQVAEEYVTLGGERLPVRWIDGDGNQFDALEKRLRDACDKLARDASLPARALSELRTARELHAAYGETMTVTTAPRGGSACDSCPATREKAEAAAAKQGVRAWETCPKCSVVHRAYPPPKTAEKVDASCPPVGATVLKRTGSPNRLGLPETPSGELIRTGSSEFKLGTPPAVGKLVSERALELYRERFRRPPFDQREAFEHQMRCFADAVDERLGRAP